MPHYEFKHVPGTPLWRVIVDGVYAQEFTDLYAAQCWVEHHQKLDAKKKEQSRVSTAERDER